MQAILIALGGIFGVFLFVVLVLVTTVVIVVRIYWPKVTRFFNAQMQALTEASEQSIKFARDSILIVLETWQVEEFSQRATPQLLATVSGGDLAALFVDWHNRLGDLVSCDSLSETEKFSGGQSPNIEGTNLLDFTSLGTATYTASFQCTLAQGTIEIQVIKREKLWFVNTFQIESDRGEWFLGEPTTLEALRDRIQQEKQLNNTIDVQTVDPVDLIDP